MFTLRAFVSALISAIVSTLLLATGACLVLMATSQGEVTRRTALFGGVAFESTKDSSGAITVSTGVENAFPLILICAVATVFFSCFIALYRILRARKQALEQRGKHDSDA